MGQGNQTKKRRSISMHEGYSNIDNTPFNLHLTHLINQSSAVSLLLSLALFINWYVLVCRPWTYLQPNNMPWTSNEKIKTLVYVDMF